MRFLTKRFIGEYGDIGKFGNIVKPCIFYLIHIFICTIYLFLFTHIYFFFFRVNIQSH